MKTTIELSDALFSSAKQWAQQNHTSLRALVEEGLRRVIAEGQATPKPAFKLKNCSVRGGKQLIADAQVWQEFEDAHVASGIKRGAGSIQGSRPA